MGMPGMSILTVISQRPSFMLGPLCPPPQAMRDRVNRDARASANVTRFSIFSSFEMMRCRSVCGFSCLAGVDADRFSR